MTYDVRVERLIDGTPEDVFEAFVDPDAMLEWYQDKPAWIVRVETCDVRVGGTTSVTFGSEDRRYREDMTYTRVDPPLLLEYDERFGMPDGSGFDTRVSITFDDHDGKTLLTIVQTGFPNQDERNAHQSGWPGFIDRLEKVVTKRRRA